MIETERREREATKKVGVERHDQSEAERKDKRDQEREGHTSQTK